MSEHSYHYRLMARAIDHIAQTVDEQPRLDDVAEAVGLSPAHFQRVFSRWAGVSPKRFQQFVTLGNAKALLLNRHTVLETALASGLTGSGRLHDLFLTWEAMSPGEFANRGSGLTIRYGWFDSPFDDMLVMATDRGICGVGFSAETGPDAVFNDLAGRWPDARIIKDPGALAEHVDRILDGSGHVGLHLLGAPFQIKVWEALLNIPSGRVTTYSCVANHIGSPRAARAVGTAVGRNPVSWLIPCHRVIRQTGQLGGYHWGMSIKRAMLAREAARDNPDERSYVHAG